VWKLRRKGRSAGLPRASHPREIESLALGEDHMMLLTDDIHTGVVHPVRGRRCAVDARRGDGDLRSIGALYEERASRAHRANNPVAAMAECRGKRKRDGAADAERGEL
jgi:hypothetical protein